MSSKSAEEFFEEMTRFRFVALAYHNAGKSRMLREEKHLAARQSAQILVKKAKELKLTLRAIVNDAEPLGNRDFQEQRRRAVDTASSYSDLIWALSRLQSAQGPADFDTPLEKYAAVWTAHWLDTAEATMDDEGGQNGPVRRKARVAAMAALSGVYVGIASSAENGERKTLLARLAATTFDTPIPS